MKMIKTAFFTILALTFLMVSCSGNKENNNATKSNDNKKIADSGEQRGKKFNGKPGKDTDLIPVSVKLPEKGDINSFLLFSSNIDSEKTVDIYPMTSGIIEEIYKDEGDAVKKGDVLARLDDREAVINEKRDKITYEQQKIEFSRQKEIFEKELISREEYDKLKFSLQKSKLDWEQKKLLLSYTRIKSPISGLVTKRYIRVGNKITTAQLTFSVVYMKEKIAVINVPEQENGNIYLKQKTVVSAGNVELNGYVKRISPAIDPQSGTFKITVGVRDLRNKLVVGQFVNVKVIKKVHKNVILVTKDILLFEEGRVFVFKVNKKNIAIKVEVKTGFDDGRKVEVSSGIVMGDKLVSAGKSTLKNNSKVKLVKSLL